MPTQHKTLPIQSIPEGGDSEVIKANAATALMDNPVTGPDEERYAVLGESGRKYLFRSKKGILRGEISFQIPIYEDWWDDPDDDPSSLQRKSFAKAYKQAWNRRNPSEDAKLMLMQAEEDNGGRTINFVPMPPVYNDAGLQDGTQIEVWYSTDSDAIAWFIRDLIRRGVGDAKYLYEIDQSKHFKVGDKRFANTQRGLQLAHIHMQESGETSIDVEEKAG